MNIRYSFSTFVMAALLVSACGDDDSSPSDSGAAGANAGTGGAKAGGSGGAKAGSGGAGGAKASDGDAGAAEACTATINLLDYKLDPKEVEAKSGKITLCAVNKGQTSHDLGVRDSDKKTLAKTKTLSPGDEDRFTIELSAATYDIYCSVAGHESLGMKGTLTVK